MRHSILLANVQKGLSLIELVTVLVILSIVAVLGLNFIVTRVESYDRAQQRSKLINGGRQAIERITRQLRTALPHSLRSDVANGLCIEFIPVTGGGSYLGPDYLVAGIVQEELPSVANGALPPGPYAVRTAPFDLNIGNALYFTTGGMSAAEVYGGSSSASISAIGASGIVSISLTNAHVFQRNSINKRFYVLDNPARFCVTGNQLTYYGNYGVPGAFSNGNPGGTASLLADNIGDLTGITPFLVSTATQDHNTVVNITIPFASRDGTETVELKQTVMIRNVP
jgi:MSHA biogenesis protein MshO